MYVAATRSSASKSSHRCVLPSKILSDASHSFPPQPLLFTLIRSLRGLRFCPSDLNALTLTPLHAFTALLPLSLHSQARGLRDSCSMANHTHAHDCHQTSADHFPPYPNSIETLLTFLNAACLLASRLQSAIWAETAVEYVQQATLCQPSGAINIAAFCAQICIRAGTDYKVETISAQL